VIDVVIARDNGSDTNNVTKETSDSHFDSNNNDSSFDTPDTPPAYLYERVHVKRELKHPWYDPIKLRYDIMLLQLDHAPTLQRIENGTATNAPFPFMRLDIGDALPAIEYNFTTLLPAAARLHSPDGNIRNRTIPNNDMPVNDNVFLALGWGHTQSGRTGTEQSSDNLQQAGLGLVSNNDCLQAHEGLWLTYSDRIFDEMMCTFSATRDSCYGKYKKAAWGWYLVAIK
jgi:hypothetical protein